MFSLRRPECESIFWDEQVDPGREAHCQVPPAPPPARPGNPRSDKDDPFRDEWDHRKVMGSAALSRNHGTRPLPVHCADRPADFLAPQRARAQMTWLNGGSSRRWSYFACCKSRGLLGGRTSGPSGGVTPKIIVAERETPSPQLK